MAGETEADIRKLQDEIARLRAEFAGLSETLKDTVRHGTGEAAAKAREAGDKAWQEAKAKLGQVNKEIEEKPLAATLTAFGVGLVLGLIFSGRRG